ncbi:nmrA-like family domain-containing protein 1 [Branchiostoma floridae]|uniref:NmrA-like family domain-containing protein 1 n=1 Tax=Branchiostoma floridae TaxID=7739 RepID=C3Z7J7_BRAFL|nr:nmrA-like family domain-containing protein 1 [Branchiostoma floridae]|eukprot:XP_002595463.1 hypothetical protein BRAFLDRAFT_69174 [Branchiostoma floridae]
MRKLITVFGASGNQGGGVVRALVDDPGFELRAVSRDPNSDKAAWLRKLGVDVVQADYNDPESLERALNGAYGCFVVTDTEWDSDDPLQQELIHGQNVADACKKQGVQHVVFSELLHVKKAIGISARHCDAKGHISDYMKQIGLNKTGIIIPFYFENLLTTMIPRKTGDNTFALGIPFGDKPMPGISAEDIGLVVGSFFRDSAAWGGKSLGVAGDIMLVKDYAKVLSNNLGPKKFFDGQVTVQQVRDLQPYWPAAVDLANMYEFMMRASLPYSKDRTLKLCPAVRSFDQWVADNRDKLDAAFN